ncbi:MAG: putative porin [Paludibacteraceae bacterium]|nr:putative porin [Paludibacteraceae bacterium]
MKKAYIILMVLFLPWTAFAQEGQSGSQGSKSKKPLTDRRIQTWSITDVTGSVERVPLDTLIDGFIVTDPALKRTIALQSLGSMGAPSQSMIFLDRKKRSDFLFFRPYELYYFAPEDMVFYNTKVPYTYLNYYSGGLSNRDERRLNGVFTVNVNPKLNFGMYGDWVNTYGSYPSQSVRNYNSGFFGSYMGKHNELMASISFNSFENYESGGLRDERVVTNPHSMGDLEPQTLPVYFEENAWSKVFSWSSSLNYKYHIGMERDVQVTEDSVAKEFVPVTSFFYSFRSEVDYKKYYEREAFKCDSFFIYKGFDDAKVVNNVKTEDSTRFWQMKHTAGIMLNEEFNSLLRFGLSAYFTVDMKHYTSPYSMDSYGVPDSLNRLCELGYEDVNRYKYGIGARLSKHLGKAFTYDIYGEYFLYDEKESQKSFNLGARLNSDFKLGKQDVSLGAEAWVESAAPDYYEEHYFSNRMIWDREFEHTQRRNLVGTLTFPKFCFYEGLGLGFKAGLSNVDNYIYFSENAEPAQWDDNIEILNLSLDEKFRLWYFHLDNEVTYQKCSDEKVIPLPELSSYSKFYFQYDKMFGVLTFQLGVDMRYNTKYYAPAYMPVTGQFYNQRVQRYGDYPYMDVFLNCHLKRARFFIQYNHLNLEWSNHHYVSMPGYALNPSFLKLGVSANLSF